MSTAAIEDQLTRLLQIGQARRPWDYIRGVGEAEEAIRRCAPVRFLLAANLGSLGFGDAAIGVLNDLDREGGHGLATAQLRQSLLILKPCEIPADVQIANRDANRALFAFAEVAPDPIWITEKGHVLWTESGKFIGAAAREHGVEQIRGAGLSADHPPREHLPPVLIAGLSTPMLLRAVLRATPALPNGYAPRVYVVESDGDRAIRALGMAAVCDRADEDLKRVTMMVGRDAITKLIDSLRGTIACALPRVVLQDAGSSSELFGEVSEALKRIKNEQEEQTEAEMIRIERSTRSARECVTRIIGGKDLRILLTVSRHTTYVRHSADDMAAAFESLGHRVTVLTEPDQYSAFSKLAYLRAYAACDPDLVLLINHPRWRLGGALPDRAPSVCWVQDAMPHLFEELGGRQGNHDFLAGYRFPEMVDRFGYRRDRVIDAPMPVSRSKFHEGEVPRELRDRMTCEVAVATRQSETPEAMFKRLEDQAGKDTPNGALVRHAWERLREAFASGEPSFNATDFDGLARGALRETGSSESDSAAVDRTVRLLILPLADRMLRHRVVEWASEICARRGWSLALYGQGWERHPTLSEYARGELLHGEELRAAYRCAAVHLNASAHSLIHQRVVECLLSGGRMLCYRRGVDVMERRWRLMAELARSAAPDSRESDGSPLYHRLNHPSVAEHLHRWERLGLNEVQRRGDCLRIDIRFLEHFRSLECGPVDPDTYRIGSAMLDHASFGSREELEERLAYAIEHRAEYDRTLDPMRFDAAQRFDARSAVGRVLQGVASALRSGESACSP